MKYYVIAGEASGDLHGSNLIKSIKKEDTNSEFRCWGGDLMSDEGVELVKHFRDLAFMGFLEVVSNLKTIKRNFDFCEKDLLEYKPDVLILIDYPGFNLRVAKFAHDRGIRVFYYISPQIWAWNQSRVHKIKANVERMFVILPFEKDFYAKYDMDVDFVGHPLLDALNDGRLISDRQTFFKQNNLLDKEIIAILPGSRKQEISRMLPVMLSVVKDFPDYQFVIAGAPSVETEFYKAYSKSSNVHFVENRTYDLLRHSKAALVTSGTATLETALFRVPEVVCYSGNYLSYLLAKQLVKVKYISLVNLVMDKLIVKELIQRDFNSTQLRAELKKLIFDQDYRNGMLKNLDELSEKLGGKGASEKTAKLMIQYLKG